MNKIPKSTLNLIAQECLSLCITVNDRCLVKKTIESDPLEKLHTIPGFVYIRVQSGDASKRGLKINCWLNKELSYPIPSFLIAKHEKSSPHIEPHHLFQKLNEFVTRDLGGNGRLILVLDNLHKLSYKQLCILGVYHQWSDVRFGTVMIYHQDSYQAFKSKSPQAFEFFTNSFHAVADGDSGPEAWDALARRIQIEKNARSRFHSTVLKHFFDQLTNKL